MIMLRRFPGKFFRVVKSMWEALRDWFKLPDLVFLAGTASLAYGLWLIDPAYAFIIVGAVAMLLTAWRQVVK